MIPPGVVKFKDRFKPINNSMLLFAHVEPWIVQFKDVETTSSFKGDILDNPPRVYYLG